ncbi:hypothetical protein [Treponema sp. J25]|uniref:hypothetical protein n=1 Tax=Treponema sp. J25 TaxID=2094121 RepID=UPI001404792D|nr:hypothetical protein [Treponema sp. J25]
MFSLSYRNNRNNRNTEDSRLDKKEGIIKDLTYGVEVLVREQIKTGYYRSDDAD